MAFLCVTFALLVSQAGAASLVRSDAALIDSMSADTTAQGILAQVEQLAQSHSKVDKSKIETIKELVKALTESLEANRQGAQKDVDRNLKAVDKCNEDQAKSIKTITETTKVTVGKERVAHADCRNKEMKTHADMFKKCTALKDFLKQLEGPAETGSDDDAMVEYVVAMDEYWCPNGPIAKEKSKVCKQAKDKHKAEKEKCDELQSQFELGFCTWRVEMLDVCDAQTTCYDDAVKTYETHKAATEELVKKWKTECVALEKISCYVKVWLNDGNVNTVDADQLDECRLLNPPCASKCHISFKEAAKKSACSLADVEHYPGTETFKSTEYGQFLYAKQQFGDDALDHFIKEPTPCDGSETTETPTAAPEVHTTQSCSKKQEKNERICKKCSTGKACGDTCISSKETCHVGYGCACNEEKAVCYAEVFQHSGFKGWKATFAEGNHDYNEFVKTAAQNDHASAIKVYGEGCQAVLYQHAGFKGTSATFTTGSYDYSVFHKRFPNDQLSSLKVQHMALDMDKITLGSAGQSCKDACASQGGCNPNLEELIFATGDAVKTMKAIAKSQGRTCSADHQNGHWLVPYINKGSSTQCNVGDGTKASDPCNGSHPADQRFCLCNKKK